MLKEFIFFTCSSIEYESFLNRSTRHIDWTLTGIPSLSGPGSDGNKEVLHIPHIYRTGASLSDSV